MSNQLQITGGAKVRNLEGVITGSTGVLSSVPLGGANGVATLDSGGKVPVSQLPSSVVTYLGTWNAATNTPTLANGTGDAGDMYLCNVAGTVNFGAGPISFNVGDWVLYGSGTWQKSNGQNGTVTSVAVSESSAALSITGSPITTAGTINIGFAGTSAQYVAGDGSLITFPSLTGYVPYTGATNDVDLGTHKLSLYSEQFASISAPTYSEGALWYDSTQKALAYYNDISGNILHIGQEVQLKVHNNTGSTIAKGAPVYVTSTSSGYSYPNVALAKADTLTTANVIGLANQAIANGADGYITLSGLLTGANTGSFTVGDVLYLSPYSAGQLMNTLPPTGYAVRVGVVSYSNTPNGTIYINQSNAFSTAANIVGTIQVSQGGTGATTAGGALTNLGAAASSRLISTTSPLQGGGDLTADRTLSILQAGASQSGYLSSTDWNTFNNKQNALGFLPIGGSGSVNYISKFTGSTTISNSAIYEGATGYISINNTNTTYNLDVTGTGRFTGDVLFGNVLTLTGSSFLNSMTHIKQVSVMYPSAGYTTIAGSSTGLTLNTGGAYTLDLSFPTTASYTYTYPSASGTLALTSNIPTISGTAPISYSAGVISISQANTSTNGYLSSTDWNTFNNKQSALTNPVTGTGTSGYVTYWNGTSNVTGSANHFWDSANNRLGINNSTPTFSLDVAGTSRLNNASGMGLQVNGGTFTQGTSSSYSLGVGNGGGYDLTLGTSSTAGVIQTWSSKVLALNPQGNNVGIGTTNPLDILVVSDAGANSISFDPKYSGGASTIYSYNRSTSAYTNLQFSGSNLIFQSNGTTERMRITSGGQVLVGTSSVYDSLTKFSVNESTQSTYFDIVNTGSSDSVLRIIGTNYGQIQNKVGALYISNTAATGDMIFRTGSSTERMRITSGGNVTISNLGTGLVYSNAGSLTSTNPSDSRLKENITDISWGLSHILKLRPVHYTWKQDKINQGIQFGFIAQEVQKVMPEAIKEFGDDVKYLGLEKDAIYATLVKAIQEQQAQIEELKSLINK